MGKAYSELSDRHIDWIAKQQMFFVATAPLTADGFVNLSPKGLDSFRVLSPTEVAYVDLTGSGVETIAHVQENGRITLQFCAFEGPPLILRIYGTGTVITPDQPEFAELSPLFPTYVSTRAIIKISATRISDSCGYSVPLYEYVGQRDQLLKWADHKGESGLHEYQAAKNAESLDGLPGLSG